MTATRLNEFVDAFLTIWNTQGLPQGCSVNVRGISLEEAYVVQRGVIACRMADGERVVGYKVGCTSTAIRQQFGLSEPIYGRLMAPHIHHGQTELAWTNYVQCAVEPEFVLSIGQDVDDDVTDERELIDAIEWVAPGIEVHNFKFWLGAPSSQELIASNGIHAGLVVGKQRVPPAECDFDMEGVGIFRDDELMASGIGAEIMGGPLKSLRWLIGRLRQEGERLRAGQLVIPGSPVELVSVRPNDRITAAFTHLGSISTRFST
jgi:2-keto-4-pentenoate hydratase